MRNCCFPDIVVMIQQTSFFHPLSLSFTLLYSAPQLKQQRVQAEADAKVQQQLEEAARRQAVIDFAALCSR